jgi:IS1 family transposase
VNRLSTEKRVQILSALCEGASVNSAARQSGASKVTILKLLAEVGTVCLDYQRATFVRLPCKRLQCDEIWSFVGAKEKHVPVAEKGRGRGDVWTWTAICAETKIIPCWLIGGRDAETAFVFLEDLASRLANRTQITTDSHHAHLSATERAFGWNGADYAMLQKLYASTSGAGRYSPPEVVGTQKRVIMGKPDEDHISTSYAERANLTMRMNVRRFRRLTNAFGKKLENHMHAVSLHFMHYNLCRPHQTLTKQKDGVHTTPAMAAGIADHVWKIGEIVSLLEASEKRD